MPKTIYLANPCGFSAQQKAELLEALGLEVWEPFERNNRVDCWAGGNGGLSENPAIRKR